MRWLRTRGLPRLYCPDIHCGQWVLTKRRRREHRQPTLAEHVIDVLSIAGCGNASRGARHLIDAHQQHPIALNLDWRKLRKPWAHLSLRKQLTRIVRLTIDEDRYNALGAIHEANLATIPQEQRRRPGRGGISTENRKTHPMGPALTALANRFEADPLYREAVLQLTPAIERSFYENPGPIITSKEEWLS